MEFKKDSKRLLIYFFYDKQGIVDDYVLFMLEKMKPFCNKICFVSNGELTKKSKEDVEVLIDDLIERENRGFDVWAYKEALEYYGFDTIENYDEVVLMNFTIMGPISSLESMFDDMNSRDLDFWGITKYHMYPENPYEIEYGCIPEHIQSHFIAIRNKMLKSKDFKSYWLNMPSIKSYIDAVSKHEAIFTRKFADLGYNWDVYVDTSDMEGFSVYPLLEYPLKLLKEKNCPIFKRRMFFHEHYATLNSIVGRSAKEFLDYIKENEIYDESLIWNNLLRTQNLSDIKDALNLNYVLPSKFQYAKNETKVCLVAHLYFTDMVGYCFDYFSNMPEGTGFLITTDKEEKKTVIENYIKDNNISYDCTVIVIENRGRDVSALLVGANEFIRKYDLVCFMHDKKVSQLKWGCSGYEFAERCFINMLGTKEYVNNIIDLFTKEKFLGVLYPLPPYHAEFNGLMGNQWGPNYQITSEVAEILDVNVNIDGEKEVIAPLGTMFWFRTKALKKMLDYRWTYEDFPEEPNNIDGTVLHAIERLYCYTAQDAGFYSASVMMDDYAQTEITNLDYMNRMLQPRVQKIVDKYSLIEKMIELDSLFYKNGNMRIGSGMKRKNKLRRIVPGRIWRLAARAYRFIGGKKYTDDYLLKN